MRSSMVSPLQNTSVGTLEGMTVGTILQWRAFAPILFVLSIFSIAATAADVSVSVDWNAAIKDISPHAWGINTPSFMDPTATADSTWLNEVDKMVLKRPLVRLHGWGMISASSPQNWLNADKTWNAGKIRAALKPIIDRGYQVIINIPDGPNGSGDHMDPDLVANPDKIASWLASLVKIVNVDNGFNVKYWEFPNEREAGFLSNGLSASQVATLLSRSAVAMKAIDPSIKVGGPATAWINAGYIQNMVSASLNHIDFVTAHMYPGGGDYSAIPLSTRYDSAQNMSSITTLRMNLNLLSPNRYLPIFISEYNISWESSPNNINFNNQGAVFDALLATTAVKAGADASQFWEVSRGGSWHSLTPSSGGRYAMSNYLTLLNRYFFGKMVSATTSNRSMVDVFASRGVSGAATTHAVMLINRSSISRTVNLNLAGVSTTSYERHLIDTNGYAVSAATADGLTLPAYSIAALVTSNGADLPTPEVPPTPTPTPVPVDLTAPSVDLTAPIEGLKVTGTSSFTAVANASDNIGVVRVEFYVNDVLTCTDASANYQCAFAVSTRRTKTYTVYARAFDGAGNHATTAKVTLFVEGVVRRGRIKPGR